MAIHDFAVGNEVSNFQITEAYGGSRYRALRVSEEKKTIVILANYANQHYINRWKGNIFYYSAFESSANGQQDMEYYPNKRLHSAKNDGFKVLLFERYSNRKNYTSRGEVEVRGIEKLSASDDFPQNRGHGIYFLLHPIKHHLTVDHTRILNLHLEILREDEYWTSYRLRHQPLLNTGEFSSDRDAEIIASLWRAYASEVIDIFVGHVENQVPNVLIPEYELERGSIKSVLSIFATVATIAGGTMGAVANYPKAKVALPIIKKDAKAAIKAATIALQKRFPGISVGVQSEDAPEPHRQPNNPTFGPPLVRQKEELTLQALSPKKK